MDGSRLLTAGLYTVPDAVRLLQNYDVNARRIRGWVAGYPRTHSDPIVENEVGHADGKLAMGFLNLMEVRFIAYFARRGVKVASIRHMASEAKDLLKNEHPFATNAIFSTDGKKIFAKSAEETGDRRLYDLKGKNWAFYDVIKESLLRDVEFDPNGVYRSWWPAKGLAPNVMIDPRVAFGQPVLDQSGVPTEALFESFNAEGETYESVAHWFEVPLDQVQQAVRFETEFMRAV